MRIQLVLPCPVLPAFAPLTHAFPEATTGHRGAAIFWTRGIARPATGEISSLSCEEAEEGCGGGNQALWVVLFEVAATPASVAAFTEREHEFRFVAVQPLSTKGEEERLAVSHRVLPGLQLCSSAF